MRQQNSWGESGAKIFGREWCENERRKTMSFVKRQYVEYLMSNTFLKDKEAMLAFQHSPRYRRNKEKIILFIVFIRKKNNGY